MYTITFYSFRGGVGRTMALVNVGLELVRRGRRVLLVDFDLEAPGLSNYEQLRSPEPHAGVVEYVAAYRDGYERGDVSPDVRNFLYPVDLGRFKRWPGRSKRGRNWTGLGKLWVMPAGKADAAYSRALMSLDWAKLYSEQEGYLFFEDTKGQWKEALKPDYVLIDSRTGHSEVEGICTRQLADAVVLMFFPNEQNLHGLSEVCRAIRQEKARSGKEVQTNLVMSNVPRLDDEDRILRRQAERFLRILDFSRLDGEIHRYESLLHIDQHLFVLDCPRSRLAKDYRHLARRLMTQNPDDREGVLLGLKQRLPGGSENVQAPRAQTAPRVEVDDDSVGHPLLQRERLTGIAGHYPDDQAVQMAVAEAFVQSADLEAAAETLDRVLKLGDNPLARLLRSRCRWKHDDPVSEMQRKLDTLRGLLSEVSKQAPAEMAQQIDEAVRDAERPIGDIERAISDLCAVIESPTADETVLLDAVLDLHKLDPAKLKEYVHSGNLRRLSPASKIEASEIIATETDSYASAVSLLRQALEGVGDDNITRALLLHRLAIYLLYRQEWREVVELPQPSTAGAPSRLVALARFHVALAQWALSGELPKDLCEEARSLFSVAPRWRYHAPDCQALALIHWRLGDEEQGEDCLNRARELVRLRDAPELSYWSCTQLPWRKFRRDCSDIERLMAGGEVRPRFLAPRQVS